MQWGRRGRVDRIDGIGRGIDRIDRGWGEGRWRFGGGQRRFSTHIGNCKFRADCGEIGRQESGLDFRIRGLARRGIGLAELNPLGQTRLIRHDGSLEGIGDSRLRIVPDLAAGRTGAIVP